MILFVLHVNRIISLVPFLFFCYKVKKGPHGKPCRRIRNPRQHNRRWLPSVFVCKSLHWGGGIRFPAHGAKYSFLKLYCKGGEIRGAVGGKPILNDSGSMLNFLTSFARIVGVPGVLVKRIFDAMPSELGEDVNTRSFELPFESVENRRFFKLYQCATFRGPSRGARPFRRFESGAKRPCRRKGSAARR